jgi:5-methylcytosine-specific restriction enzyme subunit McrC
LRIIQVVEDELSWIPGLVLDDLPQTLPSQLKLSSRNGALGIRAEGVVGTVPLANGQLLRIRPKVGEVNFLGMLMHSEGLSPPEELMQSADYGEGEAGDYALFFAQQLIGVIDRTLSLGVARTRELSSENSDVFRGNIDVSATALGIARKSTKPVRSKYRKQSHNSPENRILAAGLRQAVIGSSGAGSLSSIEVLQRWSRRVSSAPLRQEDVRIVQERLSRNWYGGSRPYYRHGLNLALIMLGISGISSASTDFVDGRPFLIESASVFEKYLRRVVVNAYGPKGYLVTKGGGFTRTLYSDGSYRIEPDIVIEKDGEVIAVIDAKYKTPTSSDHYQMLCYLSAMGASTGILLTPNGDQKESTMRSFRTFDNATVIQLDLPISNLSASENALSRLLELF